MAVKKSLLDGYTYQDLFDTQEALDSGLLNEVRIGTTTDYFKTSLGKRLRGSLSNVSETSPYMAGKDNFGSAIGQSDAIAAFKKRKLEQQKMAQTGVGIQQSILGGGAF